MTENLIDLAKGYLTNAALGKVSEFLGEDSSSVTKVMSGALPTLLGGIMNQGSTQNGLSSLMGLLNQGNNSGILDNLGGVLGSKSESDALLSSGSGLLSGILGNNMGSIVDLLGSFGGLKKSSTSSILSIAAPLLMSVIGKQVKSKGLGLSGLASLLMGQKDSVKAAMPSKLAGIGDLMNFSKLGDYEGDVSKVKNEVKEEAGNNGFNFKKWLIPALIALAALWFWKNCQNDVKTAANTATDAVTDVATDAAGTVGDLADGAVTAVEDGLSTLGEFFSITLPNGIELNIPKFGIEAKLLDFIKGGTIDNSTWFNFDRINFDTGSADLSAESAEQVKNISDILSAYEDVNLKIGGYTDNTGNPASNLTLSQNRANTVMNALIANGIESGRLSAEGFGDAHPIGDNATEEGRKENRRIAVRRTK